MRGSCNGFPVGVVFAGAVLAWLIGGDRAYAQGRATPLIPLVQVLAEADQAVTQGRPAEAAPLLELVLERHAKGEPLPQGLTANRLRLAAAAAFFHAEAFEAAARWAQFCVDASTVLPAERAEAWWVLGLALSRSGKLAEALQVFAELETVGAYQERARFRRAVTAQAAGQTEVAIEAFEGYLGTAVRDAVWGEAALALIQLHLKAGNLAAASRGLESLRGQFDLVDNRAGLEILGMELGDAWLSAGDAEAALAAYDVVSPRAELMQAQQERNGRLERQLQELRRTPRPTPEVTESARQVALRGEAGAQALAAVEAQSDYDQRLQFRRAQAFLRADKPWEAALVLERLLLQVPESTDAALWALQLVRAYADARRVSKAEPALDRALAFSPATTAHVEAIASVLAVQSDLDARLALLDRSLLAFGASPLRESVQLMRAHTLFEAGRYDDVRGACAALLVDFPATTAREEVAYLSIMAGFIGGGTARAVQELDAFLIQYPDTRFAADARYRRAAAAYGTEDFDAAAALCRQWLDEFGEDHEQRGEVLALAGDIEAARENPAAAIDYYRQAQELPLPDELLGYVLDELTRWYEQSGQYATAAAVWETFATERPEHPFVLHAAYWIGRLRARAGQSAEALPTLARLIRPFLGRRDHDGVERALMEFAALWMRVSRESARDSNNPEHAFQVVEGAIHSLVGEEGEPELSEVAQARVRFLESEFAALRRDAGGRTSALDQLATMPLEALPAGVLGRVGEHVLERGDLALAQRVFQELVAAHGRSMYVDFGYVGLGEVALRENRPADALKAFEAAVDRAGARFKLREATLGRARALLALGRWEEARPVFEQVASNREWRGEATAESVFSLGEILFRQGGAANLAQAQAHFQRVYLSYRKFVPWVVRAYLRSAETFERLEQAPEAAATLRELLRDTELRNHPEAARATARLVALESQLAAGGGG